MDFCGGGAICGSSDIPEVLRRSPILDYAGISFGKARACHISNSCAYCQCGHYVCSKVYLFFESVQLQDSDSCQE